MADYGNQKAIAISVHSHYQTVTELYGNMAILLRKKKHKSIIIKSQTKKRVHHELMAHPSKTINNFTKLITYQSSSFCLPASLLHPM